MGAWCVRPGGVDASRGWSVGVESLFLLRVAPAAAQETRAYGSAAARPRLDSHRTCDGTSARAASYGRRERRRARAASAAARATPRATSTTTSPTTTRSRRATTTATIPRRRRSSTRRWRPTAPGSTTTSTAASGSRRPRWSATTSRPTPPAGHWLQTEYGWTWISDWDWGWAPFHYGRWLARRRARLVLDAGHALGTGLGQLARRRRVRRLGAARAATDERRLAAGPGSAWRFAIAADLGRGSGFMLPQQMAPRIFGRMTVVSNARALPIPGAGCA